MPKMPEAEKKEESAESLAEKKEQVCYAIAIINTIELMMTFFRLEK